MIHAIENVLHVLIELSALLLEAVGVFIVVGTAIRTGVIVIRRRGQNDGHNAGKVTLMLGHGISLALTYLLASEVLHTLVAKDTTSLLVLGMTMALRAAMTLLIHWETHAEEKHMKEEEKEKEEKAHHAA